MSDIGYPFLLGPIASGAHEYAVPDVDHVSFTTAFPTPGREFLFHFLGSHLALLSASAARPARCFDSHSVFDNDDDPGTLTVGTGAGNAFHYQTVH